MTMIGSLREVRQSLRHLERLALGTPYPEVVVRVREVARSAAVAGRGVVVADATGVGGPVVDLLKAANLGCELVAVTITGADRASRAGGGYRVPKKELVTGLQVLLETGGLRIAGGSAGRGDVREGADGDAGAGDGEPARAIRGVAGGDARRPGAGGGAGVLAGGVGDGGAGGAVAGVGVGGAANS
jgi:hypothetical protein